MRQAISDSQGTARQTVRVEAEAFVKCEIEGFFRPADSYLIECIKTKFFYS